MGSSRPAFRDGQSSIRKEISRLSGIKRKTIVFKAMVFFVNIYNYECMDCVPHRGYHIANNVPPTANWANNTLNFGQQKS